MPPTIAILSYHKIGAPPRDGWVTWNYVAEDIFRSHLAWFSEREWDFLSVQKFTKGLADPSTLSDRSVLITFDDAYRSILHVAFPILKEFSAPAAVFIPTSYAGGTNTFDTGFEPTEHIMDWEELATLDAAGISAESHGLSHRAFSSLSSRECHAELADSRDAIRLHLKKESRLFAFPYGDKGQYVTPSSTQAAGYQAAFLYGGGPFCPLDNGVAFLPRLAMGSDSDLNKMMLPSSKLPAS